MEDLPWSERGAEDHILSVKRTCWDSKLLGLDILQICSFLSPLLEVK